VLLCWVCRLAAFGYGSS